MAEAIVGPLVGKLQELALSEAKALVAVNDDIRGLRDRLMWTQAFLRHADHRRRDTSDELIRVWLKQTRDVAFDAEDAIDQYFLKVDLSRYPSWTQSIIRFFAGFTTQVSVRHNLSSKIAEINSRLEDIIKNKDKYKIEDAANNLAMVPWKPSTTISIADTNLDDVQLPSMKRKEQDKLEEELRNPTNNSLVIYVTGESGVGKTTLVREVYERTTIKMKFEVQAWAKFPPHLSSSNILQLIHQELTDTEDWLPRKGIDNEVQKELENKTFLLVIDGEVSNTEWNGILAALPDDKKLKKDSRVVRIMHGTTPEVPRGSAVHNRIEVSRFDKTTTTDLFRQRVHMEENVEDQKPTNATEMGTKNKNDKKENDDKLMEDIYHITGGLPLAIVLLCGLVKRKEFPNEWRAVFEHLKSKQSKRLDSILTMCFDDLPHDLKSCFLYFAALPMNTPIEARKLVCMWMAEGFLRPKYGKTMEAVGRIYLKELIARHLVKFVNMENFSGDDEFVTVHHKVHAFLQLEAQEANFVEIHNGDDIPSLTTARRLSLQNYTDKYAALANFLPKLRSILSNFQEEIEDDVEDEDDEEVEEEEEEEGEEDEEEEGEQKEDRDGDREEEGQGKRKEEQEGVGCIEEEEEQNSEDVVDGDNKQKGEDEEEKNIEKGVENERNEEAREEVKPSTMPMSNLLRCWGQGASPKESIKSYIRGTLRVSKFLRVINLQGIEIGEKLTAKIGNVVHLQYLGVTACSLKWIPSTIGKLTNLQTLDVRDTYVQKLPTAFWKIRTLRHVFGSGLFLPKRVGDLKHLQTLETIQHDKDNGWDSKAFEKMVHLKSIDIWDLSDSNAKDLFDAIDNPEFLEYLVSLTLHVKNISLCVFTSSSQRRLRAMKLDGKLDLSMPSEPTDSKFCLPNLTLLSLEKTEVSQDFINKLGKLPSLANLILDTNSYKDDQLVFLAGGFRSLTKLTLSDLENLKKVEIGKSALPELTELVIVWYPEDIEIVVYGEREFVKKILLEDEDLRANITQIPIAQKKITQVVASSSA